MYGSWQYGSCMAPAFFPVEETPLPIREAANVKHSSTQGGDDKITNSAGLILLW